MASEGGTTSVQVALRIKPITEEDLENLPSRFQRQVLTVPSNALHQVIVEGDKRQIFHFDHVFPPETTQQEVYERAVENLVDKFLEGYNVTILAYGQTSSGKTHTMGTADNPSVPNHSKGLIPRAMATLFNIMNTSSVYLDRKFSMKVSFIEIYNEDLIDLLAEGEGDSRPQVIIREDSRGNIYWSGLQEVQVNNVDEVMTYLARGSLNRQVGATDMNAKSSRSHAIFSVTMSQQKFATHNGNNGYLSPPPGSRPTTPSSKLMGSRANSRANSRLDYDDGDWVTVSSKFHFVDLAGSERLKRTAASGERAKEGISINSGLLALGNVISALGDPTKAKHTTHIPYRDSKLTRLLQDSLGGNAQTLMIACVSPAEFNLNETLNTLKYANRARNIKNIAAINQEETGWNDIGHLQSLVIKLRNEITTLKVTLTNNGLANGTISPGRVTPVGGRETPSRPPSRMKSPTAGYHSGIGGRVTPTTSGIPGRSTPTGIPGRSTPTSSGIPTGIPGRSTPTPSGIPTGIPGRSTPTSTSSIPGPSGIPGRNTPTTKSGIPSGISGRVTPTSGTSGRSALTRRPSSPLTTFSQPAHNHKDIEVLEEQLSQLQRSYAELSRKYAKTSAELAMHQDNHDELNNLKAANKKNFMNVSEPVIEEYEKTISSLESDLAIRVAELSHSESLLKEQGDKINTLEKHQEQTKHLNSSLQKYIKELESKLETREIDARSATAREEHSKEFVSETVRVLEERLKESEAAFKELEAKLKNNSGIDQDKQDLLNKINNKDKRISFLDTKLNQLGSEVEKLRKFEKNQNTNGLSSNSEQDLLTIKSLEAKLLQTETELNETRSKYEKSLSQIQELQSQHDNNSTPITPMSPMSPDISYNEFYLKESNVSSRLGVHRKAKSLSSDLKSEKRDLTHAAIVEKLQFELKLFESLHKDKQQSLDAVKHELDLLEVEYQETLQLVDELREELKATSTDKPDNNNVRLLQEEVEQFKEKQKQLMESIMAHEVEKNKKVEEIKRLELNIQQMAAENSASENEITILRERVAQLQAEAVSNTDHENTIKRLEKELREVKEAHKLAIQEKTSTTISRDVTVSDETSADKLEQNIDENVIALEDTVRNLETQLRKARENVDQDIIINLQSELSSFKSDIKNKDDLIDSLRSDIKDKDVLIDSLEQELDNKDLLQKNFKDKETELAILTKQLMDLRKQDENMQKRTKELQAQLGKAEGIKEINKLLEDDLDNIKKELQDVKEKEAHALEQLRVLGDEESKLQQELERIRNVEIAQREQIVVLEAQLSEQGAQIDGELINVKSELAISKDAEIKNKQTIAELESKLNKSESIISTLQSEIEVLNSKENETLTKLRKELSDTKLEMESQNELLSELGNQLTTTEKERDQFAERANELSRIIEEQESQQKEEIKVLELTITNLKNELNDTKTESQIYQDKMKSLGEKLSDIGAQLDEAKASNEEHVQMVNNLNSTLKEYNNNLTEKQELILTKETHIKELEETVKMINEKLADAELSKTSESEHVKSLRNKISEIEAKLEQSPSPADLESAQQYSAKQIVLVKELERKIDEINETNLSEVTKLERKIDEINETNLSEVTKLNENIDSLTNELNETKSAEEAQNSLIHELESELKEKEEKLNELRGMLDDANAQLAEKNDEHLNVKVNLEQQVQQVQQLQQELDSMANELTDIATKYEDAEIISKEYKQKIPKLEVALEEAKKLSSDKHEVPLETSDSIAQDNLIKSLQEKIIELERKKLDDPIPNSTEHEIEIKELNQKISKLEKMNEEKSKSIESLERSIRENGVEITESRQKLEELQREKDVLIKEIETLKVKLEEKEKIEVDLEEERKARREVEAARVQLENARVNLEYQLEELQVSKKSRFMCF